MKKVFPKWIFFLTSRYLVNKKRKSALTVNLIATFLLTFGVAILVVVISIMNGMQMKFINDILDISSYHLQASSNFTYSKTSRDDSETMRAAIAEESAVTAVFEFIDADVILKYDDNDFASMVRGLPENILELDPSFMESISMYLGKFDLSGENNIILGRDMHQKLGSPYPGTKIKMLVFREGRIVNPVVQEYNVAGIYQSEYIEIENTLVFMNISDVADFARLTNLKYGIKIQDKNRDREVLRQLEASEQLISLKFDTWRSYNKSFFTALKMEKIAMMFLLGMIVFIVAFSLYYSLKRVVFEKNRDIAILRSFGATPIQIKIIFILEGLFIGFFGSFFGIILGLLFSINFQEIMGFFLGVFTNSGAYSYYLAQSQVPYLMIKDIFTIYFIALFAPAISAYLACKRVSEIKPSEVLRYE
ncbi:MAG: ABC transporter permease [Spirochaetales bacterium]|nr:ABC transporter permease [Spirochaetales bacterium]